MQLETYALYAMALLLLVEEGNVESDAPYAMALLLLVKEGNVESDSKSEPFTS